MNTLMLIGSDEEVLGGNHMVEEHAEGNNNNYPLKNFRFFFHCFMILKRRNNPEP